MKVIHCDIAIIGGSLGGVAATYQLPSSSNDRDLNIILTSASEWLGGQLTSQGVSAPDEHAHIETFGATKTYLQLREMIRHAYQTKYNAPAIMAESILGTNMPLNPGNGWVSRLCCDPRLILENFDISADIYHHYRPMSAVVENNQVISVKLENNAGEHLEIYAQYFLDATDTGDLLPLTQTAYVTGAESQSDTGEPQAPVTARPNETQGFTYCFAVEYCAGENHTIDKPEGYDYFRDNQPYTLSPIGRDGQPVIYKMFEYSDQGNLPFWSYRRIHDGTLLGGNDISLINWISNDYHGGNILDVPADEQASYLDEAKSLSLGFLYWLQTECLRDDGGYGYPELKLRPDVMGTSDGLSQMPYIRESRRIVPQKRIVEQDITAEFNKGARAKHFTDSVGIGWYAMDLHPCVDNPDVSMYAPTKPFQIPLGALIPHNTKNLIPACKNIGTTHLTNGAYRLHPIEWAIGEAASTLANFCISQDISPQTLYTDAWKIWRLQARLVQRGCPIFWAIDIPIDHSHFEVTQLLLVRDLLIEDSPRWHRLEIGMNQRLGDDFDLSKLKAIANELNQEIGYMTIDTLVITPDITWESVCNLFNESMKVLA
ncbi:MAG: FAD-dependent oxidoreductase [Chloroflexota bacterium]